MRDKNVAEFYADQLSKRKRIPGDEDDEDDLDFALQQSLIKTSSNG